MKENDLGKFEEIIGVKFNSKNLLEQALTHRSYLNEHRGSKSGHNERLEFLGDAVLELAVTDYLYRKYPNKSEGDMTSIRSALVNADTCAKVASDLSVNDFILLSKGEAKDTGRARQYILANALEAIIGAIYVDQGYGSANDFITKHVSVLSDQIVSEESWVDSKSRFQEKAQEIAGVTPSYKTLKEIGPDHDKKFTVGVFMREELVAEGEGDSKQEAEQLAAKMALKIKNWH